MNCSRDGAGLPGALFVSVLLLVGVAGVGIAAGPEVVTGTPSAPAQPESSPAVEDPAPPGTPLSYLREALGEGFREDPTVVRVVPGSAAATGLPAGFDGVGQATVRQATETLAAQCPVIDSGSPDTCEVRTVADGAAGGVEVAVQIQQLQELDLDQGFATIAVYFLQPGGDLVQTSVTAIGEVTPSDDVEALAQQIGDWLAQFETALIRAAIDPRMRR